MSASAPSSTARLPATGRICGLMQPTHRTIEVFLTGEAEEELFVVVEYIGTGFSAVSIARRYYSYYNRGIRLPQIGHR